MALPIDGSIVIEPNVCAIVGRVFCVRVGQNDVADLASGAPPSERTTIKTTDLASMLARP